MISYFLNLLFIFYFILILIRILLSWVPNVNWYQQPLKFLLSVVEPYLELFRRFIPPVGMLDFSSVIAIIVLQIVHQTLIRTLSAYGL